MRHGTMSAELPVPAGPYSHVVRSGHLVICSGQGGIAPDGALRTGLIEQAEQCFANVLAALAAAGAAETDVVKVGVYLTTVDDFAAMNEVYARMFTAPYPARTTVYVGLPPGLLIEVDVIADLSPVPPHAKEHP